MDTVAQPLDFAQIFRAELPYVLRSLQRLGVSTRDLEDVAQDVFIHVHRRIDEYDPARPIRPWLFAFCFRTAQNHLRLARHRERPDAEIGHTAPDARTPFEAAAEQQTRARLLSALNELSLERKSVLILHDIDGVSAPDIARQFQMPVNTVYSRLRLARRDLKAALTTQEESAA